LWKTKRTRLPLMSVSVNWLRTITREELENITID